MRKLKKLFSKLSLFNFLFLLLAGIINAIGVTIFIAPVQLYDSGISGTSILLSQVTPEWFSLSFFLLALNIPLFLFGLKKQGAVFTVYAVFTVAVYSLAAWLITDILPVDVSIASPLAGTDLFLCAIFGGIISGITMVFVPSVSTFYISQKLGGGKFDLVGDTIERQFMSNYNYNMGASLSLILMIIIVISMAIMNHFGSEDSGVIV